MDEIVASGATGTWRQHHYDARGHCILLTTSAGAIMEQYDYDAFGRPYFYGPGGSSMSYSWYGNRFLFTGREWIRDLRLYDYRARMYQPELGRFLQPDPQEFAAGDYNLYRYCHNDPVNKSDPTGLIDLTSAGRGDWDWFNGRVAAEMIDSRNPTVTGMRQTEAPRAPKSQRPASDRSKSMTMDPARDPKDPKRYLADDYRYYKYYYHQLKSGGKPEPGYGNYVQEVTKVVTNECQGCKDGKFGVRTSDGEGLYELPRSGLFRDRVGPGTQPSSRVSGTLTLDQHFRFQRGDEQPVMLNGGIRHVTTVTNGQTTNTIEPIEP